MLDIGETENNIVGGVYELFVRRTVLEEDS